LGIGTNAPPRKLSVTDSTFAISALFGGQNAAPSWVGIGCTDSGTSPIIQAYNNSLLNSSKLCLNPLGGNVLIGTTTDAGFKLDVNGSVRATGSISAASAIARGTFLNQTLVATANNDVLVGLDIQPTFTTGAFTGVTSAAIRVGGNIIPSSNGVFDLGASTRRYQNGWFSGSVVAGSGYFSNLFFGATNLGIYNSTSTQIAQIFSTGNLTLQNGGTFTDAGFRLDVNGTARVQGALRADNTFLVNGTAINPSAIAQFDSGTRGFLPPRMTTTQKNAIASPAVGLVVYDTTLNKLCVRGASAWETITSV
jgi:hypothetical protein